MNAPTPTIGVDLGATQLRLARVLADGTPENWMAMPTEVERGWAHVFGKLVPAIRNLQAPGDVAGIGVAVAGGVDVHRGLVTQAPNIPMEKDWPLAQELRNATGLPVRLVNDANAFALGENWAGAGKGMRHMVGITLGSGVGGGIIADGKLLEGAEGLAGEIGHMAVGDRAMVCACGGRGCLESLAGGLAMAKRHYEMTGEALDAAQVLERARKGDTTATNIVDDAVAGLGRALTTLVNLFNPEAVVIGGGVAAAWEQLVRPAEDMMRQHAFRRAAELCTVLPAAIDGGRSGVIGAARLAMVMFLRDFSGERRPTPP